MTSAAPSLASAWHNLSHVWLPYTPMASATPPLPVVSAAGVSLHLADGGTLIDGISSWWTACHGHNHPHIVAALKTQAQTLHHVMFAGLANQPAYLLAERLARALPDDLNHVFFAESGSVAVEIACKMAFQAMRQRGQTARDRILAFDHAYHGDTFLAMALTDPALGFHAPYQALLPHERVVRAALPTTAAALSQLTELFARDGARFAAAIVEPLAQGAGGFVLHDAACLRHIRRLCDEYGVWLIFDEIMTGFGRTGALFACQAANVTPDMVCLAKALSGGALPLAATVARAPLFAAIKNSASALMHGPTFMGNALACAAANASLDLFEREPRLEQVAAIAAQLSRELAPCRSLPGVADVRIMGAMGVVELKQPAPALSAAFAQRGVWLRPFGRVVYTLPPLIITPAELARITTAICEVVADLSVSSRPSEARDVV